MIKDKKIYIAGCGGMLGQAFYKRFSDGNEIRATDIDVNEEWLHYCDVRNFSEYKHDAFAFKPHVLIHLAAMTNLELCEGDPDNAYKTNTLGVENAVYIANTLSIPLVYISTAGIFDGQKEFYDDWDIPNPLGVYARSKYLGERFVVENSVRYLVCRAGWMMGGGPRKDKKFVRKLIEQIENGCRVLHIVNDKLGTPTYTNDFAMNVDLLLSEECWGLYNLVCRGFTDRVGVARAILQCMDLSDFIDIKEVNSDFFRETYFAPRPACERLLDRRLELRGLNRMRDWRVALEEYLSENFSSQSFVPR
jgi:dTDP-4-dehydrorhamnose reductase